MPFYQNRKGDVQELSLRQIALIVLADRNEEHKLCLDLESSFIAWDQHSELLAEIEELKDGNTISYVGSDIASSTMPLNEVVARIINQPDSLHLVHNNPIAGGIHEQAEWAEWRQLRDVYERVQKVAEDVELPPPLTARQHLPKMKLHDSELLSRLQNVGPWDSKKSAKSRRFEQLKNNYDPSVITQSKIHLSQHNLYEWSSGVFYNIYTVIPYLEVITSYIKKQLRTEGVVSLTGIGSLRTRYKDGVPSISFKAFPSFKAKLNGRKMWQEESPIGGDAIANTEHWCRLSVVRKKKDAEQREQLSAFRKTVLDIVGDDKLVQRRYGSSFNPEVVHTAYFWKLYLEFIAYYLWKGQHVLIPTIGSFRLRRENYPNTFRSVRFRISSVLSRELEKNKGESNV